MKTAYNMNTQNKQAKDFHKPTCQPVVSKVLHHPHLSTKHRQTERKHHVFVFLRGKMKKNKVAKLWDKQRELQIKLKIQKTNQDKKCNKT